MSALSSEVPREHVERRVELASIALAEVGITPLYTLNDGDRTVVWPAGAGSEHRKAIRLARLKLDGPTSVTVCDAHTTRDCGGVTVVDALLGRLCHRAKAAA